MIFWSLLEKKEQIKEILKLNKMRITQSRLAVIDVLLTYENEYLNVDEIHQVISESKNASCDRVSVYRILYAFEELGILVKSHFQGDAVRYSLGDLVKNRAVTQKHEHFFKCIKCNLIEPFQDCFISKKERELVGKGYKNLTHHLEIKGLCPGCATP